MRQLMSVALPVLLALGQSSCVGIATPPGTFLATTPPGASVVIDGRDSGFVTPCLVDLREGAPHGVRLELPGYEPALFVLNERSDTYWIPWSAGYTAPHGWRFGLFLPSIDLFVPMRIDKGLSPGRVHLRLEPTTEEG